MPSSLFVQKARTWIATLRWFCALLRRRLGSPPFAIKSFILRLRAGWMFTTRSYVDASDDPGFLHHPDRPPKTEDIQILPSMQPTHRAIDAVVIEEEPRVESKGTEALVDDETVLNNSKRQPRSTTFNSIDSAATFTNKHIPLNICPIFPEDFRRYYRETIQRNRGSHTIQPHTLSFAPDILPNGWISYLHGGVRYFCDRDRRIFTDTNICDHENLQKIDQVVDQIIQEIRGSGNEKADCYAALLADSLIDLVIDTLPTESAENSWGYYLVNHSERCPFWVHPILADNLVAWNYIEGPIEKEQLRHAMECQYYQHCSMFPNSLGLNKHHIDELQDYLIHCIADESTSLISTVSVSIDVLNNWLSVAKDLQCDGLGSAFFFARLMTHFAHDRFLNFHGLPCARLSVGQSVYDDVPPGPSILFRALSPILFFSPQAYLRALDLAYTDGLVFEKGWKALINKLNREWEEFTRLATIILNANVGLLAISSFDAFSTNRHSAVQILSYLSILTSIGSMVLGLLLARQNRAQFNASTYEISASVYRRTSNRFGLELPALIFALPSALLMWSMIFFFGAFMAACMQIQDATAARSSVGGAALVIVLLVAWCIWDAWDMQAAYEPAFGSVLRERIQSVFQSVFHGAESIEVQPRSWEFMRIFSSRQKTKDLEEPKTEEP